MNLSTNFEDQLAQAFKRGRSAAMTQHIYTSAASAGNTLAQLQELQLHLTQLHSYCDLLGYKIEAAFFGDLLQSVSASTAALSLPVLPPQAQGT